MSAYDSRAKATFGGQFEVIDVNGNGGVFLPDGTGNPFPLIGFDPEDKFKGQF